MCVIVVQPAGKYLAKDLAYAQWKVNNDGAGFVYFTDDGTPVVYKSMNWEQFWGVFERARSDNRDKNFLLHFRIATHGSVDLYNVHPFQLPTGEWLAHNGIFHDVPEDKTKQRSDTQMFIDEVVPELPVRWYASRYLASMVEDWMGWSKLVVLDQAGEFHILNERKGTWFEGMWFSNSQALPKPATPKWEPSNVRQLGTGYSVIGPKEKVSFNSPASVDPDEYSWEEPYQPGQSFLARQELVRSRIELGLTRPIDFDTNEAVWYCRSCLTALGDEGWCDCYDMYDMRCMRVLEDCDCPWEDVERMPITDDTVLAELVSWEDTWAT